MDFPTCLLMADSSFLFPPLNTGLIHQIYLFISLFILLSPHPAGRTQTGQILQVKLPATFPQIKHVPGHQMCCRKAHTISLYLSRRNLFLDITPETSPQIYFLFLSQKPRFLLVLRLPPTVSTLLRCYRVLPPTCAHSLLSMKKPSLHHSRWLCPLITSGASARYGGSLTSPAVAFPKNIEYSGKLGTNTNISWVAPA